MGAWYSDIVTFPRFDDEDATRAAAVMHVVLLVSFGLSVIVLSSIFFVGPLRPTLVPSSVVLVGGELALLLANWRGYTRFACWTYIAILGAIILVAGWFSAGIYGSGVASFATLVVVAGLVLGPREAFVVAGVHIAVMGVMLWGHSTGREFGPPTPPVTYVVSYAAGSLHIAVLLYIAAREMQRSRQEARDHETAQRRAFDALQQSNATVDNILR